MRRHFWAILFSLTALHAEDISGIWQGTLGEGTDKIRLMLRIAKGPDRWTGTLGMLGAFEGALNPGGASIMGTWI